MQPTDPIKIDTTYDIFSDAVLTALERDTGQVPIVGEILRILKIKIRKKKIYDQRCANLRH